MYLKMCYGETDSDKYGHVTVVICRAIKTIEEARKLEPNNVDVGVLVICNE